MARTKAPTAVVVDASLCLLSDRSMAMAHGKVGIKAWITVFVELGDVKRCHIPTDTGMGAAAGPRGTGSWFSVTLCSCIRGILGVDAARAAKRVVDHHSCKWLIRMPPD